MYRQYENPKMLEERLKEIKEEYRNYKEELGREAFNYDYEIECLYMMSEEIRELEQRINFAYQDETEGEW